MGVKLDKIVIIGAGVSGIITAIALRKEGYEVDIYEKDHELSGPHDSVCLEPETILSLKSIGLLEAISAKGFLINELEIRSFSGQLLNSSPIDHNAGTGMCVHGGELYKILLAQLPEGCIYMGKNFLRLENINSEVLAHFETGPPVSCGLLIGADGINSKVREHIINDGKPSFCDYMIWHGVLEYSHKEITANVTTEILGNGKRFGIIPLANGRIGWWATANETLKNHRHMSGRKKKLVNMFRSFYDPVSQIINTTDEEKIIKTPVFNKLPLTTWHDSKVALLGDSAHPITHNRGQGTCLAIEDAILIAKLLSGSPDLETALIGYESQRAPKTNFMMDESLQHGEVGQWENSWAIKYRNFMIRRMAGKRSMTALSNMFHYQA